MPSVLAYAAKTAESALERLPIERREPGPRDVEIEILFCGVCHSDLHTARNEWGGTKFPVVPGHEIVGRVKSLGANAKKHRIGDMVGVGCLVDSCRTCEACREGDEQFCTGGSIGTYGGTEKESGKPTNGGYAKTIVVDEDFALRIPAGLDPAEAAPLLCAGITTYSPLKHWKVGPGQKVGIVGLGGLGHMGLKLAHAMGAKVVLFTTTPGKAKDALALGADEVVVSTDKDAMRAHRNSFHFILNTVAVAHDLNPFMMLLRRNGTMCLVGAPATPHPATHAFLMIGGRRSLSGSPIGGIAETQEMLDFCAAHKCGSTIEKIPMSGINEAYERMLKSDVRYRFVIDMATLD